MVVYEVLGFVADVLTVFGPSIGYGFQYLEMDKLKSSAGFAPQVSLIVMISMIARMYFWVAKPFAYPVLFQAVCLYLAQVLSYVPPDRRPLPMGQIQREAVPKAHR